MTVFAFSAFRALDSSIKNQSNPRSLFLFSPSLFKIEGDRASTAATEDATGKPERRPAGVGRPCAGEADRWGRAADGPRPTGLNNSRLLLGEAKRRKLRDARLVFYHWSRHRFVDLLVNRTVWEDMGRAGLTEKKTAGELVLLVPDYRPDRGESRMGLGTSVYPASDNLMRHLLRLHTRMTPLSVVALLEWNDEFYGYWDPEKPRVSSDSALRARADPLFDGLPTGYRVHCVGHAIGAHVCAALCRRYQERGGRCARIVGLSPGQVGFAKMTPPEESGVWRPWMWPDARADPTEPFRREYMLRRGDAEYVAVVATSEGSAYGPFGPSGDDYIRTGVTGDSLELCPAVGGVTERICCTNYAGKTFCEQVHVPWNEDDKTAMMSRPRCSYIGSVLVFMKALDVADGALALLSLRRGDFQVSAWTAYSASRDYTHQNKYLSPEPSDWSASLAVGEEGGFFSKGVLVLVCSHECYANTEHLIQLKSRHFGEYFVQWYFGDVWLYRRMEVMVHGQGVLFFARYYTPGATAGGAETEYGEPDPASATPMSALGVRALRCEEPEGNFVPVHYKLFRDYECAFGEPEVKLQLRTQMRAGDPRRHVPVPPACGCAKPFRHKTYAAMVHPYAVMTSVGEEVNLTEFVEPDLQFVTVTYFMLDRRRVQMAEHTVMTYWDPCEDAEHKAFRFNVTRFALTMKTRKSAEYTVTFYYELYLRTVRVHASPSNATEEAEEEEEEDVDPDWVGEEEPGAGSGDGDELAAEGLVTATTTTTTTTTGPPTTPAPTTATTRRRRRSTRRPRPLGRGQKGARSRSRRAAETEEWGSGAEDASERRLEVDSAGGSWRTASQGPANLGAVAGVLTVLIVVVLSMLGSVHVARWCREREGSAGASSVAAGPASATSEAVTLL